MTSCNVISRVCQKNIQNFTLLCKLCNSQKATLLRTVHKIKYNLWVNKGVVFGYFGRYWTRRLTS